MFKPMLAPNDAVDLDNVKYPLMASYKLDGIRCIFLRGKIVSRSLKPIQNKQLKEKLEPIRKYSEEHNCIIDGEIYSPNLTFQEITRFVMTQDFEDSKSVKKHGEGLTIPESLKFYSFDVVGVNQDGTDALDVEFHKRLFSMCLAMDQFRDIVTVVKHEFVNNKEDIENLFKKALEDGEEGLILRDPEGRYKCGRGTIKEGLIFKVKPFITFDAEIIGVGQSTVVDPKAEKKVNELGRSVTSKKKGDRIHIERACEFHVIYENPDNSDEGVIVRPVLAMTNEEKDEVWKNRESYIGKIIEYKGMLVGAKDVPRHPVFVRFREDKAK